MTLGVSGGDYIFQNYLDMFARKADGFQNGGSVTLSGGLVLYATSGTYVNAGSTYNNAGSYLTFTAGSTVPRIDLVFASGTGYNTRAGTYPSATEKPNPPQLLEHEVAVAHVTVPSGATALTNANVRDIINFMPMRRPDLSGLTFTKVTATTGVTGAGFFVAAFANDFISVGGASATATGSIAVKINGSDFQSDYESNVAGPFTGSNDAYAHVAVIAGLARFTTTLDIIGSGDRVVGYYWLV